MTQRRQITASISFCSAIHRPPSESSKLPGTTFRTILAFLIPEETKDWTAPSYRASVISSFHSATTMAICFAEGSMFVLTVPDFNVPDIMRSTVMWYWTKKRDRCPIPSYGFNGLGIRFQFCLVLSRFVELRRVVVLADDFFVGGDRL